MHSQGVHLDTKCTRDLNSWCASHDYCRYTKLFPHPPDGVQLFKPLTPVTKFAYVCTDQCFTPSRDTLHDHGKGSVIYRTQYFLPEWTQS